MEASYQIATILGITLSEYLPFESHVSRTIVGSSLANILLSALRKTSILKSKLNSLYFKYLARSSALIISKEDHKQIFGKLESYILTNFASQLKCCQVQVKDGKINFSLNNSSFSSIPLNDYYNDKKILINFQFVISNKKYDNDNDDNKQQIIQPFSFFNLRNNIDSIIISSSELSLEELKNYLFQITAIKIDSRETRIFRANIKISNSSSKKSKKEIGYGEWDEILTISNKRMANVILDEKNEKELYDDVKWFLKSERFYNEKGWAWKRGYLLYGPPGTGKTSVIKAIANEFPEIVGIFTIDLQTIANCENGNSIFQQLMSEILVLTAGKPYILAIEDVDRANVWPRRHTYSKELYYPDSGLHLGCILNEIDGVLETHGRILFLTANDITVLKEAQNVLLRPGRIDKKIFFDNCNTQQAKRLLVSYYGDSCLPHLEKTPKVRENMSPCLIINLLQTDYAKDIEEIKKLVFDYNDIITKDIEILKQLEDDHAVKSYKAKVAASKRRKDTNNPKDIYKRKLKELQDLRKQKVRDQNRKNRLENTIKSTADKIKDLEIKMSDYEKKSIEWIKKQKQQKSKSTNKKPSNKKTPSDSSASKTTKKKTNTTAATTTAKATKTKKTTNTTTKKNANKTKTKTTNENTNTNNTTTNQNTTKRQRLTKTNIQDDDIEIVPINQQQDYSTVSTVSSSSSSSKKQQQQQTKTTPSSSAKKTRKRKRSPSSI